MTDLASLTYTQLQDLMRRMGQAPFRAGQIFAWIARGADGFDCMSDLSSDLRSSLAENFSIAQMNAVRKLEDPADGTVKYLYELSDGALIESAVMRYRHGSSVCISSQAGCRMGCRFCASTLAGKQRDLSSGEMLRQVIKAHAAHGISSVVVMGVGEPLDNYDNLLAFLDELSDPRGMNMSLRHVSVSTCGIVDKIYDLAERRLQLTLSVSLHAPDDATRDEIMPVNKKWNVAALMKACRYYAERTGRRISFEYTLIRGLNDTPAHARALAALVRGMNCHINLIPVNYVPERGLAPSGRRETRLFYDILQRGHVTVTVRRTLGRQINAACGQLRLIGGAQPDVGAQTGIPR